MAKAKKTAKKRTSKKTGTKKDSSDEKSAKPRKKRAPAKLTGLDELENLHVRVGKKSGKRKLSPAIEDSVSEHLSKCQKPSEVAALALKFGIKDEEIQQRATRANNFGQFRMVLGARMRGIFNRMERSEAKGIKLKPIEAAYPKGNKYLKV